MASANNDETKMAEQTIDLLGRESVSHQEWHELTQQAWDENCFAIAHIADNTVLSVKYATQSIVGCLSHKAGQHIIWKQFADELLRLVQT